jgi:hypothetical protein
MDGRSLALWASFGSRTSGSPFASEPKQNLPRPHFVVAEVLKVIIGPDDPMLGLGGITAAKGLPYNSSVVLPYSTRSRCQLPDPRNVEHRASKEKGGAEAAERGHDRRSMPRAAVCSGGSADTGVHYTGAEFTTSGQPAVRLRNR